MSLAVYIVSFLVSTLKLIINPYTLCTLLIGLSYIYYKYSRRYTYWHRTNITGPRATFPLGNYNDVQRESHLLVHKRWINNYGKLFGVYDILQPKLIVSDANLIKKMLVENFSSLVNRRTQFFDHPMEKRFSFVQEGEQWRKTRAVFTASFTSVKLKGIYEQMNRCGDKLIDYVHSLIESNNNDNVDSILLFKNYTSDCISRSIFSASFIDTYSEPDKIVDSILSYFLGARKWRLIVSLLLPEWFKKAIYFSVYDMSGLKYPWSLFTSILRHRRRVVSNGDRVSNDILQQMMESASKVNWIDDDILANLLVIYTAGSHTSTVTLSNIAYMLAKYPRVHDGIVAEYNNFLETGDELTFDSINSSSNFKYLDSVISETLRLLPPSTYNERKVSAPSYTFEHNGQRITLSHGDIIYFPTFLIHRDPEYWVDGDKFDETRFTREDKSVHHPYAYLPFGHGPRNCIGTRFALTQIKVAILKLVARYKFSLVDETFDLLADFSDTDDELLATKPFRLIISPL